MSRPIFTSGTARGGTNLRAQILSVNSKVRVASDPFLPLFRGLSKAILTRSGDDEVLATFEANPYMSDYYFSPSKLRMMKYIQSADLNYPFDMEDWPRLRGVLAKRANLASANLIEYLDDLPAVSFQDVLRNALGIIERAYGEADGQWVGFNDNWAVEFFAPLARAFPDAKFMIFLRDPRAAIDASLYTEPDPLRIPHVVSFARHWRKYVAFAVEYSRQPLFKDRLYVSSYEELLGNPAKHVTEMCEFLDIDFDPGMFEPANFRLSTGESWKSTKEIYARSVDIWRERLPAPIVEVVELICGAEMKLLGQAPTGTCDRPGLSSEALRFIIEDSEGCRGWRSDFGTLEKDVGFELFRQVLLTSGPVETKDHELIERSFLFTSVYEALQRACINGGV